MCSHHTAFYDVFAAFAFQQQKISSCPLIDSYFDFGFLIWVYMLWLKSEQTDMVGFGLALADFIVIGQDVTR